LKQLNFNFNNLQDYFLQQARKSRSYREGASSQREENDNDNEDALDSDEEMDNVRWFVYC
jgi:hypothetical protein